MKKLLLLFVPLALFAQIEVDTVIQLPSFIIDGWFMSELNRLYLVGRGEHFVLDCSTYQVRARFPRTYSQTFGLYSWNWRRQKLYTSPYMGVDSITVFDAAADTIMRMIPRVGDAGVYVGSTDRFYRPLAHIGLVGIDCATDTVVSTIPVPESGYGFSHPSWDSVGNRLYVPIDRWGYPPKVAVYDCATDSLLTLIDVPSLPNVMNFDYARHKAYYTPFDLTGSAGAIDIEHDSVIRLFPFNSGNPWNGVALDTTDRKAYILGADTITGYPELFIVDCTTDSIIKELTFPHKPWPVDFLQWVPWSNRVYLTRRQASSHQNLGMYVVDCKTDSVIVSDLVLGYWPPFDFQIDPIRERVFAIGAESTSVHVLRDVVSGVAETPTPGPKPGTPFKLRELRDAVELEYHLEAPCWVDVAVFDPCGRRIKTLVSARQMPGRHDLRWDRTDWYETKVARGAYFVLLDTGTEQARLKAVVR